MKIRPPQVTVIEEALQAMTIEERIETCGRICYKSEEKIAPGTAMPFCEKMVSSGHGAVLEMAVVHLVTDDLYAQNIDGKYLAVSQIGKSVVMVSGSIRAFLEYHGYHAEQLRNFLSEHYPVFFEPVYSGASSGTRFATPEEIPITHQHVAVKFIVNRAVSHELVRHRPCSFLQESQRYCGYNQGRFGKEVTFIKPWWYSGRDGIREEEGQLWMASMKAAEDAYLRLLELGCSPQEARTVLPNSTKTEIIVYASLPEWWHIFKLRNTLAADPSMREVMYFLEQDFQEKGWMNLMVTPDAV